MTSDFAGVAGNTLPPEVSHRTLFPREYCPPPRNIVPYESHRETLFHNENTFCQAARNQWHYEGDVDPSKFLTSNLPYPLVCNHLTTASGQHNNFTFFSGDHFSFIEAAERSLPSAALTRATNQQWQSFYFA